MKETLAITIQVAGVTIIAFALMFGLGTIIASSETGRNALLNVATGIAIWWMITMLQGIRDESRTCTVCQRLNRVRCPVCNTPHQSE